jgi:hypothetical protein
MEIASFPAQSLADIGAKCAFAAEEELDTCEVALATVEGIREDVERLSRGLA